MNSKLARTQLARVALMVMAVANSHCQATATVLYSQDFESTTPGVVGGPSGDILYSTINLLLTWEYSASGGANGSKGMTVGFDGTGRPSFAQSSIYAFQPTASDASPLDNGLVTSASQIKFEIDLKPVGNVSPKALRIGLSQTDPNYEADRGLDANGDGDMLDSAVVFRSLYTPTAVGGQYTHVSFTLDQGEISADIAGPNFTTIPLTPQFDPTVGIAWGVGFGISGFGADRGNSVSVDNISVESVPEHRTIGTLAGAISLATFFNRRRPFA